MKTMIIRRIQATPELPLTGQAKQEYAEEMSAHIYEVVRTTSILDHPNQDVWLEEEYRPEVTLNAIENMIVVGGFNEEQMVACGILNPETGLIWGVYIRDEYKGKGYGTEIVNKLIAYNSQAISTAAILNINEPSLSLFSKLGFATTYQCPSRLFPEWDVVFMGKPNDSELN